MPVDGCSSVRPLSCPFIDVPVEVACRICSAAITLSFPLLSDWRDRRRIEHLRSCFPSVSCSSCGATAATPGPVVVLRPGDPIPVLFCVRDADPAALAHLSEGLATQVNDDGVIPGPVANTDVDLIGVVADRYSGFQLAGVDAAGQESSEHPEVSGWLSAMRTNHDWPNVVSAENTYLSAENEADAHTVMEREPVLTGVLSSTAELGFRAVDVAARITADQLVPARGVEDV